jgi:hypothetical protein
VNLVANVAHDSIDLIRTKLNGNRLPILVATVLGGANSVSDRAASLEIALLRLRFDVSILQQIRVLRRVFKSSAG